MKKIFLSLVLAVSGLTLTLAQPPVKSPHRPANTPHSSPPISFRYAARVARRAVVSVRSDAVIGSGVIIADSGYIVTNFHVVDHGSTIRVMLHDERSFRATLVGFDQRTDLALLRIDAGALPFLHYAASGSIDVGDVVLAVGHPFGLPETVTMGIVSAKGRTEVWREGGNAAGAFLQTDAVVNPGNSGGALVDLHGRLAGITDAIATPTGEYAGYSYAIPAEIVEKTVRDLIRFGKVLHGDLGVAVSKMDTAQAHRLGFAWPTGLYVDSIDASGPAAKAGLRRGDVITSIDEYAVESTTRFQELVARHNGGETISLAYAREGNIYRCYPRLQWESHTARQDH